MYLCIILLWLSAGPTVGFELKLKRRAKRGLFRVWHAQRADCSIGELRGLGNSDDFKALRANLAIESSINGPKKLKDMFKFS